MLDIIARKATKSKRILMSKNIFNKQTYPYQIWTFKLKSVYFMENRNK